MDILKYTNIWDKLLADNKKKYIFLLNTNIFILKSSYIYLRS